MIGTHDEAMVALLIEAERRVFDVKTHEVGRETTWESSTSLSYGDDWIHLGAGMYRSVWRSPSNVAYKVHHDVSHGGNQSEFAIFEQHRQLSDPNLAARIPTCHLWRIEGHPVLAVEVVAGTPTFDYNWGQEVRDLARRLGVNDLHPWNVLTTNTGQHVIIDFGM